MNPQRLDALRARRPLLGTWLSLGSPVVAELAAESGFDWLLFDLEHGCGTEATLLANLQAVKGTGAAAVVRVGAPHPDLIQRALDWGADSIMVPHVASAAEAEACVRAMRYAPHGCRGMSRTVRAYRYGLTAPAAKSAAPVLFVQIETIAAVECVREIAAVDGVDVLFVGPGDLGHDIGVRPGGSVGSLDEGLRRVLAATKAARKPAGILLRDLAEASRHRKMGFTHIAIDSDLAILREGYQRILGQAKVPFAGPGS
ncbi:MAG: aldolase/citrate lyase family protein [Opitutaceae bacterium]|jgi:2-dehydro-3-deoxyglucarate aldolase/4-hydroxy-2-oxoheptanedioate aldolase